ncbi:hypothetical protein E0Z10_g10670 [Xylaria hypoxylon]|uniref:Uncharacterized protein n=1 Tax=Xylaria hypoxylon TaxID=37992 RepID=A0A4Z0YEF7_9PEZI|nr:hypothetical protein E0Z10_g10670 [Xylaria hypoxylon]
MLMLFNSIVLSEHIRRQILPSAPSSLLLPFRTHTHTHTHTHPAATTCPPPLGGIAWFGNFVRTLDDGAVEVYRLPTGTPACRAFMQSLCMNQEEGIVAAAPSVDIIFKVSSNDNLADAQAKFVRRIT